MTLDHPHRLTPCKVAGARNYTSPALTKQPEGTCTLHSWPMRSTDKDNSWRCLSKPSRPSKSGTYEHKLSPCPRGRPVFGGKGGTQQLANATSHRARNRAISRTAEDNRRGKAHRAQTNAYHGRPDDAVPIWWGGGGAITMAATLARQSSGRGLGRGAAAQQANACAHEGGATMAMGPRPTPGCTPGHSIKTWRKHHKNPPPPTQGPNSHHPPYPFDGPARPQQPMPHRTPSQSRRQTPQASARDGQAKPARMATDTGGHPPKCAPTHL